MSASKKYKNNQQKNKYNKKGGELSSRSNIYYLLPIVFIMSILPFIVYLADYTTPLTKYSWFSTVKDYNDFFLYYKHLFFVTVSVIMVAIIIVRAFINQKVIKYNRIFIPLGLYALLCLLSSFCSQYASYTYTGSFAQFESVFALLGYCITVYYIYLFVQTEEDFKFILYCFIISVFIMGILGVAQASGYNPYNTDIVKRLISPKKYWGDLKDMKLVFGNAEVFLTLYNPNYAGVYTSLVLPILFILTLYSKNYKTRIFYIIAMLMMAISLFGSRSAAGIIGIGTSILLFIIIYWNKMGKYKPLPIIIIIVSIFMVIAINSLDHNIIVDKFNTQFSLQKTNPNLNDIQTNKDNVLIKYKGNIMKITFSVKDNQNCNFTIKDSSDKDIPITNNKGTCTVQDNRFPGFLITPTLYNKVLCFSVTIDNKQWFFTNQIKDKSYYYLNKYGRPDKINTAPSAVFTGHESLATNRGYMWSRTIPLLSKYIIVGSGADTFVLDFPQRDYVNLNNFGFADQLITRPHCLYLQIATQTGFLSLIAFLVFYIIYFISSVRLYVKSRLENYYERIGAGILVGTFSYMICGLSNDSCIAIAPVFWALMGLGIVLNVKVKELLKQASLNK